MEMNRRQSLGVIGLFVGAPGLLVKPQEEKIEKIGEDFIPTGFPAIDANIGGGLRPGIVSVFGYVGCGKSAFLRTVSLNAAGRCSVATVPEDGKHLFHQADNEFKPFGGKLSVYQPSAFLNCDDPIRLWDHLTKHYDVIIDESFQYRWVNYNTSLDHVPTARAKYITTTLRWLAPLAHQNKCCILLPYTMQGRINVWGESPATVGYPHNTGTTYMSSVVIRMDHMMRNSPDFRATLEKNRWGRPKVQQYMRFDYTLYRMIPCDLMKYHESRDAFFYLKETV